MNKCASIDNYTMLSKNSKLKSILRNIKMNFPIQGILDARLL